MGHGTVQQDMHGRKAALRLCFVSFGFTLDGCIHSPPLLVFWLAAVRGDKISVQVMSERVIAFTLHFHPPLRVFELGFEL